jgi:signal transduction histidine kinase
MTGAARMRDGQLSRRLLDLVTDMAVVLGFTPSIRIATTLTDLGTADSDADSADDMAEDLVVALREALANIARHARARSADVAIGVDGGRLTLNVADDGVGMGANAQHAGLADLRRRAERRGGTLRMSSRDPSGTRLIWSAPI